MNLRNKLAVLALSLVIAAGMLPVTGMAGSAYAASKSGGSSTLQEIARQMEDSTKDPFAFRDGQLQAQELDAAADYPSKYDLRDVNGESYVTPVKFQNPFGTCWGFAAIAAAESSILGSGLAQKDGYDANTLDLSEKHLANFLVTPLNDPDSPQNGEGLLFKKKGLTLSDKLNSGGNPFYATGLFSSGMGPDLEDRKLSDKAPAGTPADIYEYHGLNKEVEKRKINGKWEDFCYDKGDDWSIPEELRFTQSYKLKESYLLPSPVKWEGEGSNMHYEYDASATAAIKGQLMQKRAVEIAFCADTSQPDQETGDATYISRNWAHYTYKGDNANHAVCIVGWDDNYSRTNFVEGHEPPEDGAWLVKNSWGSGEREFPNRGYGDWGIPNAKGEGTGYFWISYYDQTIGMAEALAFDESNVNSTYYLHQYDYMPVSEVGSAEVEDEVSFSNVFQADECEQLEQISCQTATPGTTVSYEVYLLSSDYKTPQDGALAASGTTTPFEYGGFHKIALAEPIIIQRGQYYSVVVTQRTSDGLYNINAPLTMSEEMAEFFNAGVYGNGVINPGESFVKVDGAWHDYSDINFRGDMLGAYFVVFSADNFPIKAYASPAQNLSMYAVDGETRTLQLNDDACTDDMRIRFRGDSSLLPKDTEITWEQIAGSEQLFSYEVSSKDSSLCSITALEKGTGYLKATAAGVGSLVIQVDVMAVPAPTLKLKAGKKKLTVKVTHTTSYASFDGCQIRYRVKGSSKWKKTPVSLVSDKKVLKKLKSGKRYQIQARDYTIYNGKKHYGAWSKVKTSAKIK